MDYKVFYYFVYNEDEKVIVYVYVWVDDNMFIFFNIIDLKEKNIIVYSVFERMNND